MGDEYHIKRNVGQGILHSPYFSKEGLGWLRFVSIAREANWLRQISPMDFFSREGVGASRGFFSRFVIARSMTTKQSSAALVALDCHAALAMTEDSPSSLREKGYQNLRPAT